MGTLLEGLLEFVLCRSELTFPDELDGAHVVLVRGFGTRVDRRRAERHEDCNAGQSEPQGPRAVHGVRFTDFE
jgi:hypothetical protein